MVQGPFADQIDKLSDADPAVRRSAAEALASGDARAIYPLIKTLRDENHGVQDAAMNSLVAIGGETTAYMVLPLLREGPFLRNSSRVILRRIGRAAVPLLRPLLSDKDDDVRTFAVDLIREIKWCEYADELAKLISTDPNPNVRASAARAVSALGYRDALPQLISALRDVEWVCHSALEALAVLKDESAVEPVAALLRQPSEVVRCAAAEALGSIQSPRASQFLLDRLPHAQDLEKKMIIRSLIQIGLTPPAEGIVDLLMEMLREGAWDERMLALKGLTDLRVEQAVPAILDVAGALDPSEPGSEERIQTIRTVLESAGCTRYLTDVLRDPSIKYRGKVMAINVIGDLRSRNAVPDLIRLMESDLREVRRASAHALAEMDADNTRQILRTSIDDRDGHVRSAALVALGRIGDRESFGPILNLIQVERYQDVLEEAVKALLLIDEKQVLPHLSEIRIEAKEIIGRHAHDEEILLSLSRDRNGSVRASAVSGLGTCKTATARNRIGEGLSDPEPAVRKAAARALGLHGWRPHEMQRALADQDPWVRIAVLEAMGNSERELIGPISNLLVDREVPVVLAAIDALIRIGARDTQNILSRIRDHTAEAVREKVRLALETAE